MPTELPAVGETLHRSAVGVHPLRCVVRCRLYVVSRLRSVDVECRVGKCLLHIKLAEARCPAQAHPIEQKRCNRC